MVYIEALIKKLAKKTEHNLVKTKTIRVRYDDFLI